MRHISIKRNIMTIPRLSQSPIEPIIFILTKLNQYRRLIIIAILIAPVLVVSWRVWLHWWYQNDIYQDVASVPEHDVAIVFGAGIRNDQPSRVLRDRLDTAIELYQTGKVKKLLMTGDNRFAYYNEPEVMRVYAVNHGVPNQDIVLDYAGRRTYDSCFRAREIFDVDRAILVTQQFHQARAHYLCDQFGVETVGLAANNHYFLKRTRLVWNVRELLATSLAWWDVNIRQPTPVLGEKLSIDI